ncbi:WAS/WASL-interacting protein family member 3-like [Capricornis sumatraensis]|uniref:WAS/WASL-interacting protein family member 3-like n=1 Tax=Capricornis sumatraensis TaxID=34865 RepID=UPI0036050052
MSRAASPPCEWLQPPTSGGRSPHLSSPPRRDGALPEGSPPPRPAPSNRGPRTTPPPHTPHPGPRRRERTKGLGEGGEAGADGERRGCRWGEGNGGSRGGRHPGSGAAAGATGARLLTGSGCLWPPRGERGAAEGPGSLGVVRPGAWPLGGRLSPRLDGGEPGARSELSRCCRRRPRRCRYCPRRRRRSLCISRARAPPPLPALRPPPARPPAPRSPRPPNAPPLPPTRGPARLPSAPRGPPAPPARVPPPAFSKGLVPLFAPSPSLHPRAPPAFLAHSQPTSPPLLSSP